MTNLHISAWRRRKLNEYPTEQLPETAGDTDPMCGTELRAVLWQALARLPEPQRTMLVLRYYEGRTDPEIAEILDISVGTVKSSIWRSLRRMREDEALSFGRDEEEPPSASWSPEDRGNGAVVLGCDGCTGMGTVAGGSPERERTSGPEIRPVPLSRVPVRATRPVRAVAHRTARRRRPGGPSPRWWVAHVPGRAPELEVAQTPQVRGAGHSQRTRRMPDRLGLQERRQPVRAGVAESRPACGRSTRFRLSAAAISSSRARRPPRRDRSR